MTDTPPPGPPEQVAVEQVRDGDWLALAAPQLITGTRDTDDGWVVTLGNTELSPLPAGTELVVLRAAVDPTPDK